MWILYTILGIQLLFWIVKWWALRAPLDKETLELMKKVDPWYAQMNLKQKNKYRVRFNDFLRTTRFIFKEGIPLDRQVLVKRILAAGAARLSLQLSRKAFDQYDRIIIYEHPYYSTINHRYHKGEVNPGIGFIVFSYEAILEGYEKKEGTNLVYHELAHALWLEHKLFDYDVFRDEDLDAYEVLAKQELQHAGEPDHHFFRDYGYTNLPEFFAVSVENFFERPKEFKTALPDLYASLAKLFKQDWT
jgi:MtfA peptidase